MTPIPHHSNAQPLSPALTMADGHGALDWIYGRKSDANGPLLAMAYDAQEAAACRRYAIAYEIIRKRIARRTARKCRMRRENRCPVRHKVKVWYGRVAGMNC